MVLDIYRSNFTIIFFRCYFLSTINKHTSSFSEIVGDFVANSLINFNRSEIEEIEIQQVSLGIRGRIKSAIGFFPEVTCNLWKRGGQGWFFRSKHSTILI